jgi:hypothetical protein
MATLTIYLPDGSIKEYSGVSSLKSSSGTTTFNSQPEPSSYGYKSVTTTLPMIFEEDFKG